MGRSASTLRKSDYENCEKVDDLGKGAFGRVYKVRVGRDRTIMAAKYIELDKRKMELVKRLIDSEKNICELSHENVLKFYYILQTKDCQLVLFTECIDGNSIGELVKARKLSHSEIVHYTVQITRALAYLHTRPTPIVHRDLKGENVMVDNNGKVTLIDFGLSLKLQLAALESYRDAMVETYFCCGTLYFMAPEILDTRVSGNMVQYTTYSDVWALGCTLYQMVTGYPPHSDFAGSWHELPAYIVQRGAPRLRPSDNCRRDLIDFYDCCVKMNWRDRHTANELLGLLGD